MGLIKYLLPLLLIYFEREVYMLDAFYTLTSEVKGLTMDGTCAVDINIYSQIWDGEMNHCIDRTPHSLLLNPRCTREALCY